MHLLLHLFPGNISFSAIVSEKFFLLRFLFAVFMVHGHGIDFFLMLVLYSTAVFLCVDHRILELRWFFFSVLIICPDFPGQLCNLRTATAPGLSIVYPFSLSSSSDSSLQGNAEC